MLFRAATLLTAGLLLVSCQGASKGAESTPSSVDAELRELAGKFSEQPAKITYDLSGSAGSGTVTLFWRSPEAWRIAFEVPGGDGSLIAKDGKTYACVIADHVCQETEEGATPLPLLSFFTDPDTFTDLIDTEIDGIDFIRSEGEIAGHDVTCFTGSGEISGQEGSAEYCLTGTGLLLRLAGGGGGSTLELEATSVSVQVSDSDFELPYPLTAAPQLPASNTVVRLSENLGELVPQGGSV